MIAAAVAIPVVLTSHSKSKSSSSSGGGGSSSKNAISGTTGSKITQDDGTTFTYNNNFGGDWAADPKVPFGAGGRAQNWSKRIGTEDWVWGTDVARGVNLG